MENKYTLKLLNGTVIDFDAVVKNEIDTSKEDAEVTFVFEKNATGYKELKKNATGGSIVPLYEMFINETPYDVMAMGSLSDAAYEITCYIIKQQKAS